jgi:hypothetical protein
VQDVTRTVGRFEIVRRIGRGGMAVVYLARQRGLDREVALKELRTFEEADSSLAERFLREARVAGAMSHPNIVTVFDYFEEDGTPFIAMEYMPRGSLRPLIRSLSVAQVLGALEGLLAGLSHAETHGVVHRDLKPENLLVTNDGSIKIADFGIAKAYNQVSLGLTGTGMAIGTPSYMSPEQAMAKEVGPWTDIYAAGAIAYELFVGRVPFLETDTPLSILWQHVHDPVPPPLSLRPDLDPALAEWLERMLAKAPADRPRSAREAWEELEETAVRLLGWRWRQEAGLVGPAETRSPAVAAPREHATPTAPTAHEPANEPLPDEPLPDEPAADEPTPAEAPTELPRTPIDLAPELEPIPARAEVSDWRWPTTVLRPALRRRGPRVAAGIAAAGAAGLAVALLLGRSEDPRPPTTTESRPVVPDPAPDAAERVGMVLADGSLVLSLPRGRLVRLDMRSLGVGRTARDPAGPRSAVVHGGAILVAERDALARIDPRTLARLGTIRFRGARLFGGSGTPAVVTGSLDAGRGRVCILDGLALAACARLPFVPSGAGAAPGGTVFVANREAGTVELLRRRGSRLVRGRRLELGPASIPHGPIVRLVDRLYVAVRRGVAVVDVAEGRTVRRIALGTTPPTIWIAPFNRRLFAPLYGRDRVAVVDLTTPGARPTIVGTGDRPIAVVGPQVSSAGGTDVVYVVNAGDRTVARIDAHTGALIASAPVRGLTGPDVPALVATRIDVVSRERSVTATVRFGRGAFERASVVPIDRTISDGEARIELRQGAIESAARPAREDGVTVRLRESAGRILLVVTAAQGRFERLELKPGRGGRAIAIVLIEPPRVITTNENQSTSTRWTSTHRTTTRTTTPDDPCDPVCVG